MSDYMKEAERLLSEYGDAVSDAVVFAQDPAGYSMRMEEATRAALLAHIQRGAVPEGWQLVPKEPTEAMLLAGLGSNWPEDLYLRDVYESMLAAAPAPDHFRDAAKMMAEPAEVPMPQGYVERPSDYTGDIWIESQMRAYGAACRAAGETAGYMRGRAGAGGGEDEP